CGGGAPRCWPTCPCRARRRVEPREAARVSSSSPPCFFTPRQTFPGAEVWRGVKKHAVQLRAQSDTNGKRFSFGKSPLRTSLDVSVPQGDSEANNVEQRLDSPTAS